MRGVLPALLFSCLSAAAAPLDELPGTEVFLDPRPPGIQRPQEVPVAADSFTGRNWMAPSVPEQLARDPVLVTLAKGALFVPAYSEPRREPDVFVFSLTGELVATGPTGQRILLDSGDYEVRFGSGVSSRRLSRHARVHEGRTTTLFPDWGGLVVETLNETGEYIDGQYDLIRMDDWWINYGRGQGSKEERLQDIPVWILPPGLYRISRVGEGYNSLRNYITVQINPGELHSVEIVFNQAGDLIAGGTRSLTTRARAGRFWTYGLRAGGNAAVTRTIDDADLQQQSLLFSTDMRLRARYDRLAFFGISEAFIQNSFLKQDDQPLRPTQDFLQLRSTWVRRLNDWVGPYVRGQLSTHLFPSYVYLDTVYILRNGPAGADTVVVPTGGKFERQPPFFPMSLAEGIGVNVDWISRDAFEVSTQTGLAARQDISRRDYLARAPNTFERARTDHSVGAEGILNGKLRPTSRFTLDLRAEVFAANAQLHKTQLENLEADFRLFLTRNVELGYLFQMRELAEEVVNRFPRTHSLSLRLSFNY